MTSPGNRQLAATLRKNLPPGLGWRDRLKITGRPYICPFGDLLESIHAGARVFDVGCGSGQFCLLVASHRQPAQLWGMEIDPRLVENARSLYATSGLPARCEFLTYDGRHFPAAIAQADVVTLIDVLHHVPPPEQGPLLQRLHAAMQPGARLLLKDIDAASPFVLINRLHDRIFSGAPGHELGADATRELAISAGFTVNSSRRHLMWGYPHFLLELSRRRPGTPPVPRQS